MQDSVQACPQVIMSAAIERETDCMRFWKEESADTSDGGCV